MKLEDVKVGQWVKLTIDRTRFDASDLAYLLRTDGKNPEPTIDGQTLVTGFPLVAELPTWHVMIPLSEITFDGKPGRRTYLAEAGEIEPA